ncbi:MAG: hypothetical protein E6J34_11270 [Chloroflexi bacterium]|nr:MAG: hypothetical protein E6J34_11270 [Chloroflexota bacterium]
MFQPLRFNPLLKAIPGLAHLKLTPQAAHHAKTHAHVHTDEQIELDRLQALPGGIKETHVHEHITKDVKVDTKRGRSATELRQHITEDIKVRRIEGTGDTTSDTLTHVHATVVSVAQIEMTPPHPPREDTPIYHRSHHHLVHTMDTPCAICGVRRSTLHHPHENPFGAQDLETHHYPIERSLMNACDPKRLHIMFPQIKDYATLEEFIDSEANLMVLCDIHHRHPHHGIHHLLAQDFFIQPFLYNGYEVVADPKEAAKVMAENEKVIRRHTARDNPTHR